jgi:hypothetical protein
MQVHSLPTRGPDAADAQTELALLLQIADKARAYTEAWEDLERLDDPEVALERVDWQREALVATVHEAETAGVLP